MLLYPQAKINIGLYITGKREDGFHNLETVFYPVPLCDVLELNLLPAGAAGECSMKITGMEIDGEKEDNLVLRAYRLLHERFTLPAVQLHLHKQIPMGAGLGGGSADAAEMLIGLNRLCGLGLSREELMEAAARLGSDCPFFVYNRPALAWGRGECMEEIALNLSDYYITLIKIPQSVSTAQAFAGVTPAPPAFDLRQLPLLPIEEWQSVIRNQFEESVGRAIPEIMEVKEYLIARGAMYASMTGSGSAVYGISREPMELSGLAVDWFRWQGKLKK